MDALDKQTGHFTEHSVAAQDSGSLAEFTVMGTSSLVSGQSQGGGHTYIVQPTARVWMWRQRPWNWPGSALVVMPAAVDGVGLGPHRAPGPCKLRWQGGGRAGGIGGRGCGAAPQRAWRWPDRVRKCTWRRESGRNSGAPVAERLP